MSAQPAPFYTPEQYLELEDDADYKSEYLSGRIVAMAGGSPEHSAIGNNIGREMGNLLKRGPCQVFNSDLRVTVMQTGLKTYPDVTVVCGEQHRHPLDKNSIINPIGRCSRCCRRQRKPTTGARSGRITGGWTRCKSTFSCRRTRRVLSSTFGRTMALGSSRHWKGWRQILFLPSLGCYSTPAGSL